MPNLNGFDANTVEPAPSFDPVPAGQYAAMIVASENKISKNGHPFLSLELEIIDGPHRGRKLWTNLSLNHPNPTTVLLARAELASICRAIGVLRPADSVQLHNLPMLINVRCANRKDTGDLQNRIKSYVSRTASAAAQGQPQGQSSPQSQPPQAPAQSQVPGQSPAAPAAGTPPWRRN